MSERPLFLGYLPPNHLESDTRKGLDPEDTVAETQPAQELRRVFPPYSVRVSDLREGRAPILPQNAVIRIGE